MLDFFDVFPGWFDTPSDAGAGGVVGAAGREAAVQAQLARAYQAGYGAEQGAYSGYLYRNTNPRFVNGSNDWTYGGSKPGGSDGRYAEVGDPAGYYSPDYHTNILEANEGYGGIGGRTMVVNHLDAANVADVSGTLPFSPDALAAPHGMDGINQPPIYDVAGESPYSMPRQVGAGASDAGAGAMIVPSAVGGDQVDLLPRNLDPAALTPRGTIPFDADGNPGTYARVDPADFTPFPTAPEAPVTGVRDMPSGTGGRASSVRYGAAGGAIGALGTDLYRSLVLGEDVGLGEVAFDTATGAGLGVATGVASDELGHGLATLGKSVIPGVGSEVMGQVLGGGIVDGAVSGITSTLTNAALVESGQIDAAHGTANVAVDTGVGLGAGLAGAAAGAALGSFFPGAGTAVGAGLGFAGGLIGSAAVHMLADGTGFTDWAKAGLGDQLGCLEDPLAAGWQGVNGGLDGALNGAAIGGAAGAGMGALSTGATGAALGLMCGGPVGMLAGGVLGAGLGAGFGGLMGAGIGVVPGAGIGAGMGLADGLYDWLAE